MSSGGRCPKVSHCPHQKPMPAMASPGPPSSRDPPPCASPPRAQAPRNLVYVLEALRLEVWNSPVERRSRSYEGSVDRTLSAPPPSRETRSQRDRCCTSTLVPRSSQGSSRRCVQGSSLGSFRVPQAMKRRHGLECRLRPTLDLVESAVFAGIEREVIHFRRLLRVVAQGLEDHCWESIQLEWRLLHFLPSCIAGDGGSHPRRSAKSRTKARRPAAPPATETLL
mmetsp:Transcript_55569/g.148204  ORF Transcript_55569/g.148204 Transcript_55569/m.148204 type:complete len:224 (+) Transcript_55569:2098-2769(+)